MNSDTCLHALSTAAEGCVLHALVVSEVSGSGCLAPASYRDCILRHDEQPFTVVTRFLTLFQTVAHH